MTERNHISLVGSLQLQQLITGKEMTVNEMVESSEYTYASVSRWIRKMRSAGAVYISGYAPDKNGRLFVPKHTWGKGEDAVRPGALLTDAERMRAYRTRRAEREKNSQTKN